MSVARERFPVVCGGSTEVFIVNAALLLMASTWSAGAEPAAEQQTVIQAQCCGTPAPVAASSCDSCGKQGLFTKLKGRFAKAPAPCCAAYAPPCDACSKHVAAARAPRPNLLDKLRDRCGKHKGGCSTCGSDCASGCGPVYGAPVAPGNVPPVVTDPKKPPMEMPPKTGGSDSKIEPKKPAPEPKPTESKKGNAVEGLNIPSIPNVPGANAVQSTPLSPVSAPKLSGADSPY
jgi:hypothetical protein